ncbi:MAG: stage V sporulation protein AB [Clostridia bacterium]|nr:stage V sporulation protein AB [Clostridia bacterium]
MLNNILLILIGLGSGLVVSGGAFTVLLAVGLLPRFADKTHTAKHIFLYEEVVVAGTLLGSVFSVFPVHFNIQGIWMFLFLAVAGAFAGIFVGCLAMAIAEMLDTIPIFTRRISFQKGLNLTIFVMAVGKTIGSLIYFFM